MAFGWCGYALYVRVPAVGRRGLTGANKPTQTGCESACLSRAQFELVGLALRTRVAYGCLGLLVSGVAVCHSLIIRCVRRRGGLCG
jgi:hypothetical protein